MKTAVVLVMVILLVSGLANAAPTEASGVIVSDFTINISQQLGLMKAGNFVIFDIEDGLVWVKEEYFLRPEDNFNENNLEAQKERYEMMLERLHNRECVYVMYNFLYLEQQEGDEAAGKTLFILWSPDEAPMKERLLYVSSKSAVREALFPSIDIEAHERGDISYSSVQEELSHHFARH